MVILLSTRGTAGSDIWFTCLADRANGAKLPSEGLRLNASKSESRPEAQRYAERLSCVERLRYAGVDRFRRPRWQSHCTTATVRGGKTPRSAEDEIHHVRRGGARSFVDDPVLSRGVVLSRADLFCDLLRLSPWTRRSVRY